LKARNKKPRLS